MKMTQHLSTLFNGFVELCTPPDMREDMMPKIAQALAAQPNPNLVFMDTLNEREQVGLLSHLNYSIAMDTLKDGRKILCDYVVTNQYKVGKLHLQAFMTAGSGLYTLGIPNNQLWELLDETRRPAPVIRLVRQ